MVIEIFTSDGERFTKDWDATETDFVNYLVVLIRANEFFVAYRKRLRGPVATMEAVDCAFHVAARHVVSWMTL